MQVVQLTLVCDDIGQLTQHSNAYNPCPQVYMLRNTIVYNYNVATPMDGSPTQSVNDPSLVQ